MIHDKLLQTKELNCEEVKSERSVRRKFKSYEDFKSGKLTFRFRLAAGIKSLKPETVPVEGF